MDLRDATLRGLDWPVVVEAWAGCARTPMGSRAVREAAPLPDRAAVEAAMDALAEVLRLEDEGVGVPVGAVSDLRDDTGRAAKGMVLEPPALLGAGRSLRALQHLRDVLDGVAERAPRLAQLASAIHVDTWVARTLEHAFDNTGALSGSAYPELADLRQGMQRLHEEIRGTLDRMVRGEALGDDLLQDRFWTVRDDRYVLPIKAHARRWNLGIVHGTSQTGHTVFVEPHEVIELNNQLRLAEGRLKAAEHAILAELSRELGTQDEAARSAVGAAIAIDVAVARAGLARKLAARRPSVGEGERIRLRDGRHPVLVLRGVDVVANDLEVGPEHPVLVLSGPNAGGKTVALKTLALCALLVRFGHYLPASEDSRVDRFDEVLAAIGDQQTVEGDLSSFSAHLVALREMLAGARPGQLLVLDEIASGTDPAQGAALAQAALEALADAGARVVVTTHFASLKGLGAADPRFAVAAAQSFDGRPTYRVVMGATGESHALAIAARVGLDPALLARAEALMGGQQAELGRLLASLEQERERAERATAEARRLKAEAEARAASLAAQEERIKAQARALEQRGAASYLERLRTAEKAIGQVVAALQQNPSHQGVKAAKASLAALQALVPEVTAAPPAPAPPTLAPGDRVRHRKLGSVGEVLSVAGDQVQLRIGGLQTRAKAVDLERLGGPAPARKGGIEVVRAPRPAAVEEAVRMPSNTLDLRGTRVEEAQEAAERFFDRAVQSGHQQVFLLHGHGTGALKDGLRHWLRSSAYVRDWCPASEEQGGDAFTVVSLA